MPYTSVIRVAVLAVACISTAANAYIGPGLGLSFMGELLTFMGGLLMMLGMVLMWPIRTVIKKWKARKHHQD